MAKTSGTTDGLAIRKAAVIGAGVMGSGIAAQIANAGVPVLLLDIVPKDKEGKPAADRSAIAKGAVEKLLKTDPAPLMLPANAALITPGNIEDDLAKLADVDWIVEAVLENIEIKRSLYQKLEPVRKKGSIVSSNTSTIPLATLIEGGSDSFARDFVITHFFNPPRYMRLLEVVSGPKTNPATVAAIEAFGDRALGKGVVRCKDTPGFIANRIGVYWMQAAVTAALDLGLTVEEADAVMGKPLGIPKTGVFGLLDLTGLDLQPHVDGAMAKALPKGDDYLRIRRDFPLMQKLIADGYTGRKGKGGFYRLLRDEHGGKTLEAIDLKTGQFRPKAEARLESVEAGRQGLRAVVEHPDRGGQYAWKVLSQLLPYTASLVPAIADDIVSVDRAMQMGYAWKWGPFELIDRMGADWFAQRLTAEGKTVPPLLAAAAKAGGFYKIEGGKLLALGTDGKHHPVLRPEGVLLLEDIKRANQPVAANGSASLWDIGDGVVCLEFHSKMNALDDQILGLLKQAIGIVSKKYKALVIYNEAEQFSVGANLGLALFGANIGLWPMIEGLVNEGLATLKALKYAPFPSVAAPAGMALGGGCEIVLHSRAIVAHAESYIGLVEVGVGLIPGWGGANELLERYTLEKGRPGGPMPPVTKAFETISMAKVSRSAAEAREMGILRPGDEIVMNRERLLATAKAHALAMVEGYKPPEAPVFQLPGATGRTAIRLAVDNFVAAGKATPHDRVVAEALADLLTGGKDADIEIKIEEEALRKLAAKGFMNLIHTEPTLARMEHMLETGKPLRN
ncbi:MAG TPA: 3-hydroxyacyl-CoA dehydrogenase NAD-binding domain-containing protein [Hypericibacter adhaerens]|uniref:3-hydroxyacyl-CoA dehydrogenase/enoyl-CoA hydratase family protein n=1 Tax=Hypericibacter adhaerens TaxID=2602016 RepID=UPI002CC2E226|nr:3-hydroxyacyl-CoA dehydrogenase NAD-binding domain-containing protein [Hypericibacter adhaerens]HWA42761.1 3-hydroxyacyl-CoA dehydrogenase NAD-binding domain-containing protein [Hypericibacter adhaerens]